MDCNIGKAFKNRRERKNSRSCLLFLSLGLEKLLLKRYNELDIVLFAINKNKLTDKYRGYP